MANRDNTAIADDAFFRKLIENSCEGITLIDRNFAVVYRSPSAERINGWKTVDPTINNLDNVIHPDDNEQLKSLLDGLSQRPGDSASCIFRSRHAKGHYIWLECTYTNMFHEPGIEAIVCNFRDISNQKQSELLLEQTVHELSAYKYALDEADIVAITDQKGIITHVNDNFCKISGYSRPELIGQDHRIINSQHHPKEFIRNLWATIANGKIWKGEIKNRAKDGTYYWVDTTIVPFLNDKGKPYQYLAIRTDITESKLVAEKIIESERFTKTITDSIPAMIAYWTADLRCLFANKALLEWFGKTPAEIHGISKRELLNQQEFSEHERYITGVLNGKPQSFERTFFRPNGPPIYTQTQYVPDIGTDGSVKGFYSLIYDYSDVRLTELDNLGKTTLINDLLENITDGFIALDENLCYTYANKQIGKMLGMAPGSLIGNHIWDLFPDAVGSATYHAIQEAHQKRIYICNEDHYEPLNLWQENRIYPSGKGLSIFVRDITERKNAEQRKELLTHVSQLFTEPADLNKILEMVLAKVLESSGCSAAEAWLVNVDQQRISLAAKQVRDRIGQQFFEESPGVRHFEKGEGLPGETWMHGTSQFWAHSNKEHNFIRVIEAERSGLQSALSLPLFYNHELLGVMVLHFETENISQDRIEHIFDEFSEHVGAEIMRKQLEQELNQIFTFTPDILCIANTDGYFKKVNPAMCTLLEYSEEELLARPFMEFVHPLDNMATAAELQNIADGRPTYYIENRYITKPGKAKWLAWTTTGASEQGTLYCSAKDITDKKELQELLDKATDMASIGGWEADLVKGTVYWSDMTRQIHETPPGFEPALESGIEFYKEGESRSAISQKIKNAMEMGAPWDLELQIITAKGNTKWVRVIGEAELLDGNCLRLYGSFQDIDGRKRAEIAAKENLEERNTILESIGDAFFAVDRNWIVTYWNNTAERVLFKTREQVLSANLWSAFPDAVDTVSYKKYHEAIETNKAVHFEDHYVPLDKWYEISAYPTGNGLSVFFKDITERKTSELVLKELNASLQKHTRELAESNAELEQFAYVASHDLQEPLRMVTSFLTQLDKRYTDVIDDRGKKYIYLAVDGAKRMRQIILDLLEFSRVGRSGDSMEDVAISEVIEEVLVLYRKTINEHRATITFDDMPVIRTAKVPVRQVFQNLISNSLKYQQAGQPSRIIISCKDAGEHWQFSVSDNGIGISDQYFSKIFILFQRLHNKDEYSGTGIGLAVTKKIIESLGGRIWLKSEEGRGSKFYFTILKQTP